MPDIITFTPRADWDAAKNLAKFVRECQFDLTALGADLPFEANIWDISKFVDVKGSTKASRVIFSTLAAAKARKDTPLMSEAFRPFAKGYFRYKQGFSGTTGWANRLTALRVLDTALCNKDFNGNPTLTTHDVLNHARDLIIENYSAGLAPKIAGELEHISDFLIDKSLVQMKTKWKKELKKAKDESIRVGKSADAARQKKMASAAAIRAMAHVFNNAIEPVEIYVGSALALMHCAPERINEVVRLAAQCEVEALDTEGNTQYGLRWPGSKEFDNSVKWIVPTMSEVARRAIKNLKEASAEARGVAIWYENNPAQLYLPKGLEYLRRKERLKQEEVSLVLYGEEDPNLGKVWCNQHEVSSRGLSYAFAELESRVIQMLPKDFPYAQPGLKFSEALFLIRRFELDATLRPYSCLIDYLSKDQIINRLGKSGSVKTSIFDRFNLKEDDGSPVTLNTHQIRHYLNTLAQANGASEFDIALWSGRADVSQNQTYDHTSPEIILSAARDLATTSQSTLFGGDLNIPKPRVLARRDTAGTLRTGTAHITDYGMCTHDYAGSPCLIHLDCLNCNELVCVKGDNVKADNIRRLKDETEVLLREAEIAEQSEKYGASPWVVHHRQTLEHCTKLLRILDNPAVQVGALVKLTGIRPASRIAQAEAERNDTVAIPHRKNELLERVKRG